MFAWFRCRFGCKIIVCSLTICSILLFSILPFSVSAATDPFDEIDYFQYTFDLFEAFPYDLTKEDIGHSNFLQVAFYNGNNFQHNSNQIKVLDLVANDISRGDTLSSWDCYIRSYSGFACRSAFVTLPLKPLNYSRKVDYLFDFYLKFPNLNGNISFYLKQLNIEYGNENLKDLVFEPASVYGSGSNYVAHFQFILSGQYLDDISERIFKIYFAMDDTPQASNSKMQLWLDPSYAFSIRPLSTPEQDAYMSAKYSADAIGNIGSNVPKVDSSSVTGNVDNMTNSMNNLEDSYTIDSDAVDSTLKDSAKLFSMGDYQTASLNISIWINRFLNDNGYIYALIICSLCFGLAFYAIGRGTK